jgi:hypothetical protein
MKLKCRRKKMCRPNTPYPEKTMSLRAFLAASSIALGLSACATQTPAPAPAQKPAAPAAAAPAPAPAPQCWNGDAGKFEAVGSKATISGVAVTCEKTTDGKNAQWMGKKN